MPEPNLAPTPDHQQQLVVVGTSVRKNLDVLQGHLASLAYQEIPERTRLHFVYVPDWPTKDPAEDFLRMWVGERGGEILRGVPQTVNDFNDGPGLDSHAWSLSAMRRVGAHKNKIFRRALELKADAVWYLDADIILDTTVLKSLLAAEKPITTAVYWTRWSRRGTETRQIHSAPQVWLGHYPSGYELRGRGMDESEFRQKLINRELTQVWGFGADTLVRRQVLETGISFDPLPDVPQQGLLAGEDRQFCIRAERMHLPAFACAWSDQFHVYHAPEDVQKIPEMLKRLGTPHPTKALLGDLVSLKLEAIEPVPHTNGGLQAIPRQHVRGRLGQIALMPELEEAIYGLERGATQIVPVHFPISHPLPYFRGRRRLIRCTLVDVKNFCFPPVLEDELYLGQKSGRWVDHTTLSDAQHIGIREVAGVAQ